MQTAKAKQYGFSMIVWHEISHLLDPGLFEEFLSKNLPISNYGQGIQQIFFLYIAIQPDNRIHEEETRYNKRKKQILFSLKLDYQQILEADAGQVRHLMADLFVNSIDLYQQLGVKDFNIPAFKSDVKNLFINEGWLLT